MLRRVVLVLIACVPLLGCSQPAPTTQRPAVEKPQPRLESVAYLPDDKNVHGFLCRPNGDGPYPALVLVHDFMGVTDGVKDNAYRLARAGYVVLAVNLYRDEVPKSTKEGERLASELPKKRALADLKAAVDYLSQRADVRPKSVIAAEKNKEVWDLGVLGLGLGGSYALDAALSDRRLRALVVCYCPLPVDAKQLKALNASVFCVLAGEDKRVPADVIKKFCQAMDNAGKRVAGIRVYGKRHAGFLDPATARAPAPPPKREEKDKAKDGDADTVKTTRTRESAAQEEGDIEDAWKLIVEYLNKELS